MNRNNKKLTAKQLEQLELERKKEERTKKLFKRLKKEYSMILLEKIKLIKNNLKAPPTETSFYNALLINRDYIIKEIVSDLKTEYYNDERYYCSNEEFNKLSAFYMLKYKTILKQVINALF